MADEEIGPCTLKDVSAKDFIRAYASHLRSTGKMEVPWYVDIIKTGTFKEQAPYDSEWYFTRAASIARTVYLKPGIGVQKFRKVYGGATKGGTCPKHHRDAAGGVLRQILQQLEKMGIVEQDPKGGRRITSTGRRDLDRISSQVKAQQLQQRRAAE